MAKLWRKPLDHAEKAPAAGHVFIDKQRCKGCGYCVEFCPRKVLQMSNELNPKGYLLAAVVDEGKCLACGFCEVICPEFAVKVIQNSKPLE
ncbi:MAG: ferredoxin family protein [Chloroflexi bacterium]|nr:ferredoxin family protein [Chloroflexota bacterium]